ncbi:hypothetical protein F3Y22_tig00110280pilonHSYRG00079 [Hibiscus syriacus]|uniref:Uncharacterized protein n=1 Tax=Hibiscus syriacus TaxID=106335 RepID=A0A6A3B8Z6_HIBSY|nr:hypothetical protein F3Y22_tig00110280pilonHSYRG00079 [Hibiscus syriacus]
MVLALTYSDVFNSYVIWLMMPYLTNVWKLNDAHAAAIINVWRGLMWMMPICMLYSADTVMGKFPMIVLSGVTSSIGFGLLSMSTPRVFTKEIGTCYSYEPKCISGEKISFFFAALLLTALGISGLRSSLPPLLEKNLEDTKKEEEIISSLSYINPWSIKFGVPAICTAAATVVFISGSCYYSREPPAGSPFTTVFRVICAATSKMFNRTAMDVAATFLPNQSQEQQKRNRWRLCRVTEVEETKLVVRLFHRCPFFIICGLVSAAGHRFFMSQANHLKRNNYPLLILPFFFDISKNYSHLISCGVLSKYQPRIGIGISMILDAICCMTAATVEAWRLNVVKSHGLLYKPDDEIPMFFSVLVPQFVLLGVNDGIFEQCVSGFFKNQVPPTMRPYLKWLSEGIRGVGIIGGGGWKD